MEPKTERFKRIASARVNKISAMIRLLGNCAHTGNYEYTDEQVELIFEKLHFDAAQRKRRICTRSGKRKHPASPSHKNLHRHNPQLLHRRKSIAGAYRRIRMRFLASLFYFINIRKDDHEAADSEAFSSVSGRDGKRSNPVNSSI